MFSLFCLLEKVIYFLFKSLQENLRDLIEQDDGR